MIDERDMEMLLRRLNGECSAEEERRLEARLAAEPELRAAAEWLAADWAAIGPPPPAAAPPGFADDVMARIGVGEEPAPAWARLAAAAALVAGIGLGVGIARVGPPIGLPAELPVDLPAELAGPAAPTLADSYWAALDELDREVAE